ncbi:MAG: glycosyltransferase family 2 protein [Rhodospirillaceae bacterium]|nr:glycosyltransferase family 2 protein [Rhodospirillaceae bacterium]
MTAPPPSESVELSVVIPVRDEAGNVAQLAAEIHAALAGKVTYEIVFVDDASTDTTPAELAGLNDARVRVFTHVKSCGQSQATITGVTQARGTWIATLDGDGQNDPADLPRLLDARAAAGAEAARTLFIGRRGARRDNLRRLIASRIANGIRGAVLGDATPDSGCGIKLLSRALFLALPRFDALHRFVPALVLRAGGRVVSLPVSHRMRVRGASKYTIWRRGLIGVVDMLGVFWLMRRNKPPTLKS